MKFSNYDWAQAILLYGLNAGTHKIALFKALHYFYQRKQNEVTWQRFIKTIFSYLF